jgi:hypothetical protein
MKLTLLLAALLLTSQTLAQEEPRPEGYAPLFVPLMTL